MPYCSIIVDTPLETDFNQLEGLIKAESFPDHKEVALTEVIYWLGNDEHDFPERGTDHQSPYKPGDSLDNMGHCITIGLSRNSQNWKLFNLAAIYWRILGPDKNNFRLWDMAMWTTQLSGLIVNPL